MIRSDLIQRLSQKHSQLSVGDVDAAVKVIIDSMSAAIAEGQRVEVRGFGSFSLRYLPAGQRRNPMTGEKIEVPGRYTTHFKPGKEMRERVDQGRKS